jgi:hypothetical protein
MPIHEVRDLAEWWSTESTEVKNGHASIRNKQVASVLVSMFVPWMIHVRGLDTSGRLKMVG